MNSQKRRWAQQLKKLEFSTSTNAKKSERPKISTLPRLIASNVEKQNPQCSKMEHILRQAVHEGGGRTDPKDNARLKHAIKHALDEKMSMTHIQKTICSCQQLPNELQMYIVQIRYKQKIYLVCSIKSDNFSAVRNEMEAILENNRAGFVYNLHIFHNSGVIEAAVPCRTVAECNNLAKAIETDAIECDAKGYEIIDNTKGLVYFKCDPLELPKVCKTITEKGYQVLSTEYGFRPKRIVLLNGQDERDSYSNFVNRLRNIPDVVNVYDNVQLPRDIEEEE